MVPLLLRWLTAMFAASRLGPGRGRGRLAVAAAAAAVAATKEHKKASAVCCFFKCLPSGLCRVYSGQLVKKCAASPPGRRA